MLLMFVLHVSGGYAVELKQAARKRACSRPERRACYCSRTIASRGPLTKSSDRQGARCKGVAEESDKNGANRAEENGITKKLAVIHTSAVDPVDERQRRPWLV
jgi:hypothetical protein